MVETISTVWKHHSVVRIQHQIAVVTSRKRLLSNRRVVGYRSLIPLLYSTVAWRRSSSSTTGGDTAEKVKHKLWRIYKQ